MANSNDTKKDVYITYVQCQDGNHSAQLVSTYLDTDNDDTDVDPNTDVIQFESVQDLARAIDMMIKVRDQWASLN